MNADQLLAHYERVVDAPDAIARLRRFILDLAVRGKLVPQDETDEPASVLLKRIADTKVSLVKASLLRKAKPLPKVGVDEAPFYLPSGWEWVRIRAVTSDHGQKVPDQDFTYVDVTAIDKEAGCIRNAKVVSAGNAPSRARKIVRKGDVLYSCVRPYLLNIAIVETDFSPPPIASTAFAVLDGLGMVLPQFQWIALRSPYFVAAVEEKMRGQAYPAINESDFALLPLPLPPLAEQHRIVVKVDELMALCDRLEAARAEREARRDRLTAASLARLNKPDPEAFGDDARFVLNALPALTTHPDQIKQLRQTILNLAVRGKLVPQDPNDEPAPELLNRIAAEKARLARIGRVRADKLANRIEQAHNSVPPGWALCRWNSIALKIGDIDHKMPDTVTDGVPYVSPRDFRPNNSIDFESAKRISRDNYLRLASKIKPDLGDLIYPRYGTIGENRLVTEQREFLASYSCAVIKTLTGFVDPNYQYVFSISDYCRDQARAAENKATQANVGIGSIKQFVVPLPPLAEQSRIVAKVNQLMALCDQLQASLSNAETTRTRLLETLLAEALRPAEVAGIAATA